MKLLLAVPGIDVNRVRLDELRGEEASSGVARVAPVLLWLSLLFVHTLCQVPLAARWSSGMELS